MQNYSPYACICGNLFVILYAEYIGDKRLEPTMDWLTRLEDFALNHRKHRLSIFIDLMDGEEASKNVTLKELKK